MGSIFDQNTKKTMKILENTKYNKNTKEYIQKHEKKHENTKNIKNTNDFQTMYP